MVKPLFFLLSVLLLVEVSWSQEVLPSSHPEGASAPLRAAGSPAPDRVVPLDPPFLEYRRITTDSRSLGALRKDLGPEGIEAVLKINRRDGRHLRPGVHLQVPRVESWEDPLRFAPLPRTIPQVAQIPRLILVSLRVQAFGAYERGRLVRWGPTSTGSRRQATPPNLYHVNWRSPRRVSTINSSWIMPWYLNLHTSMGIALHQYELPGYPASYGCIRLLRDDAYWLYHWVDLWVPSSNPRVPRIYGTPVVVFGEYDYDSPPPWEKLHQNPAAASVLLPEIQEVLEKYLPAIEERTRERELYFESRGSGN